MNIVLFIIYIFLTVGGLILVKLGGGDCSFVNNAGAFEIVLNAKVLIGLFMYMCSFLTWMYLVSTGNLTILLPLSVGIVNVSVLLISSKVFNTTITPYHWVGVALVLAGIAFMSFADKAL